jgi:hypothetical protein
MLKKQQIFFLVLAVFSVMAAVWAFVDVLKNNGVNSAPSQISHIGSVDSAPVSPDMTEAQPGTGTAKEAPYSGKVAPSPLQAKNTGSIALHAGEVSIMLAPESGTALFDILSRARDAGEITFTGKQYSGLGFYVTSIGSLHESAKNHLFYYINGKPAAVGISSNIPKDGDIIDWKLE